MKVVGKWMNSRACQYLGKMRCRGRGSRVKVLRSGLMEAITLEIFRRD